jgi:hypothetical protein
MSTSGITSSLLSQIASSPLAANQFVSDLNQVTSDLQSGNLSAAQEDYVTLSSDALNGATSSAVTTTSSGIGTSLLSNIAMSPSSSYTFVSELNQISTDLGNNDMSSAQGDMITLSSTALNAASSTSSTSSSNSSSTGPSVSADVQTDIRAVIAALSSGDSSDASSEMAQLSSDAQNSSGTNYFKLISGSSNSSSTGSTTSTQNSIATLLQSLDSTQTNANSLLSSAISSNS